MTHKAACTNCGKNFSNFSSRREISMRHLPLTLAVNAYWFDHQNQTFLKLQIKLHGEVDDMEDPEGKLQFPASFPRVAGTARVFGGVVDPENVVNVVEIEAAVLLAGLVFGKLELRDRWMEEGDVGTKGSNHSDFNHSHSKDSLDELISLMKGSFKVDEYQFKLKVGKKMWASVASWVVLADYGGTMTAPKTNGVDFLQCT
ncbi:MAG: hypothetical protein NXY57DRAFT_1044205 [Lentinula lateritia]|nr:MAG: hypothetical protein NXY57DRAFT_1044205 [Lentinula lateritia]